MYKATSEASIDAYLMKYQRIKMEPTKKVMYFISRMN